jgi:hypothetical protein
VRRALLLATLAAALFVLGSAQAKRAPRIVTLRNSGESLTLHVGAKVQLHLTERYRWLGPRVRSGAVRLVPIRYSADPGYLAWFVAARARGKAIVTAAGYGFGTRECGSHECVARRFRVTFVAH